MNCMNCEQVTSLLKFSAFNFSFSKSFTITDNSLYKPVGALYLVQITKTNGLPRDPAFKETCEEIIIEHVTL